MTAAELVLFVALLAVIPAWLRSCKTLDEETKTMNRAGESPDRERRSDVRD